MSSTNIKRSTAAWIALGVALALLVLPRVVAAQCAMCRTALLNSAEGQQMVGKFNTAILFLMSAPFVVVATVAFLIFRANWGRAPVVREQAGMLEHQSSAVLSERTDPA